MTHRICRPQKISCKDLVVIFFLSPRPICSLSFSTDTAFLARLDLAPTSNLSPLVVFRLPRYRAVLAVHLMTTHTAYLEKITHVCTPEVRVRPSRGSSILSEAELCRISLVPLLPIAENQSPVKIVPLNFRYGLCDLEMNRIAKLQMRISRCIAYIGPGPLDQIGPEAVPPCDISSFMAAACREW